MAMPMPLCRCEQAATGLDRGRPRLQNGQDSGLDRRTPGRPPLPHAAPRTPKAVVRTRENEEPETFEPETFEDRRNGAAGLGIP